MSASVQVIQSQIDSALVNSEGEVNYEGANGQQAILTNLNEAIRDKGVYYVPVDANGNANIGALTNLGGDNAQIAFVENSGFYKYKSIGGWTLVSQAMQANSETAFGVGGLSVTITHNLGTTTPTILVFRKSSTSTGLPYTEVKNTTNTIVDEDNVTVLFPATTTASHLIIVKP